MPLIAEWPVLSIKQPWAQLILTKQKDVEVRTWARSHRGLLWIHTGQEADSYASDRFDLHGLYQGGIVGSVELFGIRPFCRQSWKEWKDRHRDDAEFDEEQTKYGWIFRNPKPLAEPIKMRGRTGLFRLTKQAASQIRSQLEAGPKRKKSK
jgi:hypothetical protein